MPQSLHQQFSHIVFSTKGREKLIPAALEAGLYAYISGIVHDLGGELIIGNGMADHVHLLVKTSKSVSDVEFIRQVKRGSSIWLAEHGVHQFHWQGGYGWFSVGVVDVPKAKAYVEGQKDHHRTLSFQDEFRRFLKRYGVDYDERYVWG